MRTSLFWSGPTLVWLVLMVATAASTWWLAGEAHGVGLASAAILVIAGVKVRLVLIHFMELGRAPWAWRLPLEAWPLLVVAGLLCGLAGLLPG